VYLLYFIINQKHIVAL